MVREIIRIGSRVEFTDLETQETIRGFVMLLCGNIATVMTDRGYLVDIKISELTYIRQFKAHSTKYLKSLPKNHPLKPTLD